MSEIKFVRPSNEAVIFGKQGNILYKQKKTKNNLLRTSAAKKKPAIKKIIEPCSEKFVPRLCCFSLTRPLSDLYY